MDPLKGHICVGLTRCVGDRGVHLKSHFILMSNLWKDK